LVASGDLAGHARCVLVATGDDAAEAEAEAEAEPTDAQPGVNAAFVSLAHGL